jgi:hypothetical protein
MKPEPNRELDPYRERGLSDYDSPFGASWGLFYIPIAPKLFLKVLSSGVTSATEGPQAWEHVSVSLPNRTPTWEEMVRVKDLFWGAEELVLQFHPPRSQYVSHCGNCLHLWRHPGYEPELPPKESL